MNAMQKEPALVAGAVAALLGLLLVYGVVTTEQAAAWQGLAVVLIPIAQALWTRSRVFSPNTIREAGLNPEKVEADAADPDVHRYPEPRP